MAKDLKRKYNRTKKHHHPNENERKEMKINVKCKCRHKTWILKCYNFTLIFSKKFFMFTSFLLVAAPYLYHLGWQAKNRSLRCLKNVTRSLLPCHIDYNSLCIASYIVITHIHPISSEFFFYLFISFSISFCQIFCFLLNNKNKKIKISF